MSDLLLQCKQVGFAFQGRPAILKDVNLLVQEGSFTALVGPSGCGKSTLLRLLADLLNPLCGHINRPKQLKTSFVFQEAALLPWLTVAENIEFPLVQSRVSKSKIKEQVSVWLDRVSLSEQSHYYPHELSGGMKMRVSIARALITNPDLLLLDEPFAALDEGTREDLQNQLMSLCARRQGATVLVTHNLVEAALLADTIHLLAGKPASLIQSWSVNFNKSVGTDLLCQDDFTAFVTQLRREFKELI